VSIFIIGIDIYFYILLLAAGFAVVHPAIAAIKVVSWQRFSVSAFLQRFCSVIEALY
jgi:hypothetical protein